MALTRLGPNQSINLTNSVTGTLPVANGGTALSSGFINGSTALNEYDQWRLTSSFTGSAYPIGTGGNAGTFERNDSADFEKIGTGVSDTSGTFTFPSTGKWELHFNLSSEANTQNADNFTIGILTTLNNSDYTERAVAQIGQTSEGASGFRNASVITLFDVTSTTNCKARFFVNDVSGSQVSITGSTSKNLTYATFKRIGDT